MEENRDKIDYYMLSENENGIELLKENQDKIDWYLLSENPEAISILKENHDKISWSQLSKNPNAIEILKENQDKINWSILSSNPSIFTYDYEKISNNFKDLKKEIIAKAFEPDRIFNLIKIYGKEDVYNTYFRY